MKSLLQKTLPLSLILGARFFGLFVVMPLLSLYTLSLEGSSSVLIGIAIGGYALTQVIFQIPFGIFSDKFGRKIVIAFGLIVFLCGSLICAISDDIYMLIAGRLLQGAGAVGGVISAMIADLVDEESRTKAMALMGGVISLSFTSAIIIGPILGGVFSVASLFWITALFALLSLVVLFIFVPDVPKIRYNYHIKGGDIWKNKNLQIMNLTNFLQKSFMSLTFLIIPIALVKGFEMPDDKLYYIYIPASILGLLAMAPAAILAEKKGRFKLVLIIGVLFFVTSYLSMLSNNLYLFVIGIFMFFVGFSMHEPIMQSMASRYCKASQKGNALGVFTSSGYLGSFFGALIGGNLYEYFGIESITIFVVISSFIWVCTFYFLENPKKQKNIYIKLNTIKEESLNSLDEVEGVLEWFINDSEGILIVKYKSELGDCVMKHIDSIKRV